MALNIPDCDSPHAARSRIIADESSWKTSRSGWIAESSGQIRQPFNRPVADVLVWIVKGGHQDVGHALRLDASVADQREVPHRVDPRTLIAGSCNRLEAIDGRRALLDIAADDIHFDAGDAYGEIV